MPTSSDRRLCNLLGSLSPQDRPRTAAQPSSSGAEEDIISIMAGLKDFDSPTIFNAVEKVLGDATPSRFYTDHTIVNLLPELGSFIGRAVTVEVTTNDPDARVAAGENTFQEYYDTLDATPGPIVAVMKDIDSAPGRGASFGDGMARRHRLSNVTGALIDGTVRDLAGIRRVGLPVLAWGKVPGHGPFAAKRTNVELTVGDLVVKPGDILFGDEDGVVSVPVERAAEVLVECATVRQMEGGIFASTLTPSVFTDPRPLGKQQFVLVKKD